MDTLLPAVAEELLKAVKKVFQETSQIPDELLLALKFLFGSSAHHALDLVDQRSVTRFISPSGRTVFQVVGSSGKLYTCYAACHYCSCPAFSICVLRRKDSLLCKHILAIYLSQAMGVCQEQTMSDKQMSQILRAKEEE